MLKRKKKGKRREKRRRKRENEVCVSVYEKDSEWARVTDRERGNMCVCVKGKAMTGRNVLHYDVTYFTIT